MPKPYIAKTNIIGIYNTKYLDLVSHNNKNKNTPNNVIVNTCSNLSLDFTNPIPAMNTSVKMDT